VSYAWWVLGIVVSHGNPRVKLPAVDRLVPTTVVFHRKRKYSCDGSRPVALWRECNQAL